LKKRGVSMFPIQIPAFGEGDFFDNRENKAARVVLIPNAAHASFVRYCSLLEESGFVSRQAVDADHRRFAAYEKDGWGVFLNYFANTAQLQLVMEENTAFFSYSDTPGEAVTTPRLTQVFLSDYGLSYVIRLADGRLMIIDGGNVYEKDIDNLFARLKTDSPWEKPVIAAWIFTHPHSDHYFCFFPFMEKYGGEVTIEKFFFHFPEGGDLAHYPKLAQNAPSFAKWQGVESVTTGEILDRFCREVADLGIPVYTPHTGQSYQVGEARLQFFASMDDTVHWSDVINATSLMFTMELGGQKIFFSADGHYSCACLAERYGSELKCDILQVPHHGFGAGSAEAQIAGFRLMAPDVCLMPVELDLAYTSFCTYREGTDYLFSRMPIQEMITGEKERSLELPYTAHPAGVLQMRQRYIRGRDDSGARTWIFTELHTGRREDFVFSVLNTTYVNAELTVELYFEDMQKKIIRIRNKGLRLGVFRLNCLLHPEEDQSAFDAPDFLESRGVPENTYFAVRFISDLPVVISHRDHKPAYRSGVV